MWVLVVVFLVLKIVLIIAVGGEEVWEDKQADRQMERDGAIEKGRAESVGLFIIRTAVSSSRFAPGSCLPVYVCVCVCVRARASVYGCVWLSVLCACLHIFV